MAADSKKTSDNEEEEVITVKTGDTLKSAELAKNDDPDPADPPKKSFVPDLKAEPAAEDAPKVTSFGLIDSDKPAEDASAKSKVPTIAQADTGSVPEKDIMSTDFSKDSVNKWIENYDETNKTPEKKEGKSFFKIFLIILLVLSLLAIITGGFLYYQKNMTKKTGDEGDTEPTSTPTITITPTTTPGATESGEVKFSDYSIQILNGSGIPGEAGKVKDLLASAKFKKTDTANADNYDYEDTEVKLKENTPSKVYDKIEELLKSTYSVAKSDTKVASSSSYDVIIIVGTKK
ncbi:hypothetical protein A3A76_03015 [Candidatus Woesebacteria bacterium RIFCSPLOWO2_01_FULL_39_23]|uniref:LytR/CpsA/Psr regulator C-terminal domain-containing protein n=1 Tax=Candidatus Woesebacteria bacterium RIFCSPHIGHO2_01_FULL_40_22 TaxID=1802499 RepID=A0A1F7YLN5_9BACT|nr:MAG: hypothetical protein A2628_01420 [Candidatus Woesebacteria bacterium RIFCSPHIGHO2_01_FULL_40_22]OGM36454.1 MAG: hypothetical protein A3E41_02930 [Candidatus Woesebacteria bacterium RIFCSPHIGHO2_12_FULL_38_9]OGM62607.1 MAG: hypothetical protein A3A76_03015 [Candidatus Woesebacteria bacterium RIFCSPLOWO2_01_FULL_39_23]